MSAVAEHSAILVRLAGHEALHGRQTLLRPPSQSDAWYCPAPHLEQAAHWRFWNLPHGELTYWPAGQAPSQLAQGSPGAYAPPPAHAAVMYRLGPQSRLLHGKQELEPASEYFPRSHTGQTTSRDTSTSQRKPM